MKFINNLEPFSSVVKHSIRVSLRALSKYWTFVRNVLHYLYNDNALKILYTHIVNDKYCYLFLLQIKWMPFSLI